MNPGSKMGFPWLALMLAGGLLAGSGCVSKKVEPEHKPRLGVSQGSDGWVTINLESETGFKYTILYEDPKDRVWKPIKGCESISGTGEIIEIRKRFNSRQPLPPLTVNYSVE
ncbi:MAG: hypothetical protein U9P12_08340 [Verrucomicrobiota bacterium]|nr:hypothetical protein [Verrucomicrobiota bacterium]